MFKSFEFLNHYNLKYKNIISAIHNFGHSFLSDMNYVEDDFVVDELRKIHSKNYDITINWKTKHFEPQNMLSSRITTSITYWHDNLKRHLNSHNVDINTLVEFRFVWNQKDDPKMIAVDDKGKKHLKYIAKSQ